MTTLKRPAFKFLLLFLFLTFGITLGQTSLYAQELLLDEIPALRDRALVLRITTKVAGDNQEEWSAFNSKVTIPGRSVDIKLVGDNVIIAIRFTPYSDRGRHTLVAQGQIWVNVPEEGMSYRATNDSIPFKYGEPILYLPLGTETDSDDPRIELRLTMYRYGEEPPAEQEESR